LGISKFDFKIFSTRIEDLSVEKIQSVGQKGREWVLQNYSPVAQAERLLVHVRDLKK
jgi:hypothetical protein